MTVKELREELKDIPDDYIVCSITLFGGKYYEISSTECLIDESYDDLDDEPKQGNIIVI